MTEKRDLDKEKYEHSIIKCPVCGKQGTLYCRLQHGTRLWCVRHGDTYHHIGKTLPLSIKDQIDGKPPLTLDKF